MALIYADNNRRDIGYLENLDFDCDIGENDDFTLEQAAEDFPLIKSGYYIYDDERREFGGRIEALKSKSENQKIIWSGKSFRGLLKNKIIETSLILTGTPREIIEELITLCGYETLYYCSSGALSSVSFSIECFTDLYSAISNLTKANGLRFACAYDLKAKKIEIIVSSPTIYYKFDSDKYNLEAFKQYIGVNHLIVIGNDIVKHLYLQSDGTISENPTDRGETEVTEKLNVSSSDASELIAEGIAYFNELIASESSAAINTAELDYKIGDKICVIDNKAKIQILKSVKSKVYTYTNKDDYKISYKTE